ncbi:hypothetical protein BDZ89DRAFT_1040020 [Hymenopellis radicata]|nr:hypothetical protein BDZ89DRAFT_1040020 [Hymenopellis radicata]
MISSNSPPLNVPNSKSVESLPVADYMSSRTPQDQPQVSPKRKKLIDTMRPRKPHSTRFAGTVPCPKPKKLQKNSFLDGLDKTTPCDTNLSESQSERDEESGLAIPLTELLAAQSYIYLFLHTPLDESEWPSIAPLSGQTLCPPKTISQSYSIDDVAESSPAF